MLQFLSNGACICMIPREDKSAIIGGDEDSVVSDEKFVFIVLSSTGKFCLVQHDADRRTHIVDYIPSHYLSLVRRCLLFQNYFSPTVRVSQRIFANPTSASPKIHHYSQLRSSLWFINRSMNQYEDDAWFTLAYDTHGHSLCLDPCQQFLRLRWSLVQTAKNNLNVHFLLFEAFSSIYCSRFGPISTILQAFLTTQGNSIEISFQLQTGEENVANCEEMLQLEQLAPLLSILPSLQKESNNEVLRKSVAAELCNSLFVLYPNSHQGRCYLSYLHQTFTQIEEIENDESCIPNAVLWHEHSTHHIKDNNHDTALQKHFVINIFSQTIDVYCPENQRKSVFHKDLFFSAVLHRLTHYNSAAIPTKREKTGLERACDIFIETNNFALLQRLFSYSAPIVAPLSPSSSSSASQSKQLMSEVFEGRNDIRYTIFYCSSGDERLLVRLRGWFRHDHLILDLNLNPDPTQQLQSSSWRCCAILPTGEQISFTREEYQDVAVVTQHPSFTSIPIAQVQELLTCLRLLRHTVDSHCTTNEERQAVMEAALQHEDYLVRLCQAKMNEIQRQQVIDRIRSGQKPPVKSIQPPPPQQQAAAAAGATVVKGGGEKEHQLHILKMVRGALDRGAQVKAENNRFLARLQSSGEVY